MVPRKEARAGTSAESRERLLEAAERLFAERGFTGASVREITSAAGCNVAAVNYHFGGKDNLYREIFRRGLAALRTRRVASIRRTMEESRGGATLEHLLGAFASAFLEPANGPDAPRFVDLIAWEWVDPHLPPEVFRRDLAGPVREALTEAIRSTCPGLDHHAAMLCVQSIVSQLVQVIHQRHRLAASGTRERASIGIEEMAKHIVRFSAAGTRACAGIREQAGAGPRLPAGTQGNP
jgi:TetR/AcrR family transcriptional regulator, regulator of cefoperazone and chloramphenicol sensitivity